MHDDIKPPDFPIEKKSKREKMRARQNSPREEKENCGDLQHAVILPQNRLREAVL